MPFPSPPYTDGQTHVEDGVVYSYSDSAAAWRRTSLSVPGGPLNLASRSYVGPATIEIGEAPDLIKLTGSASYTVTFANSTVPANAFRRLVVSYQNPVGVTTTFAGPNLVPMTAPVSGSDGRRYLAEIFALDGRMIIRSIGSVGALT